MSDKALNYSKNSAWTKLNKIENTAANEVIITV